MNLYNKYILPKVTNYACSTNSTMMQRQKVVPHARGHVLEIGIGSGLNIPFYVASEIDKLTGLDPSSEMLKLAKQNLANTKMPITLLKASSEEIPLVANSIDTVLITYTLCTIPNLTDALKEIKRVLKKDGQFIFCEHGLAPDKSVQTWQNRINPLWKKLGGGCNLNRKMDQIIRENGFKIQNLDTMYIPGWKFASYNYWGTATI